MSEYHKSVLLDESVSALLGPLDGVYADATFGGGGHTSEILSRISPNGLCEGRLQFGISQSDVQRVGIA